VVDAEAIKFLRKKGPKGQIGRLEKEFVEEGGLSERMTRARLSHRQKTRDNR